MVETSKEIGYYNQKIKRQNKIIIIGGTILLSITVFSSTIAYLLGQENSRLVESISKEPGISISIKERLGIEHVYTNLIK